MLAREKAPVDYCALAEFRYLLRRFLRFSEEAARAAGLEPQQHQFLLARKGLPPRIPATMGELAARLQLRHHTVVELVDRLERRGLVERRRNSADRRQVFVDLTPAGERLLDTLSVEHREELESAGPALLEALSALLKK